MKMIHYWVEMSDGNTYPVQAHTPAEAQGKALEDHLGLTVKRCWRGSQWKTPVQADGVEYEVPPHQALHGRPAKARRGKADKECTLFEDKAVVAESDKVRSRLP